MSDIGVRELKIHASEIVHKVKQERARYIITHHGRPVAAIVPIEEAPTMLPTESVSAWDELVALGQQIAENWRDPHSGVEILSEMRR